MEKIGIIGAGYVGLVTAVCLSKKHHVVVVEKDRSKLKALQEARAPFFEPGLQELLTQGLARGLLSFVSDIESLALEQCSIIFSCVGTPSMADGSVDLSDVFLAVDQCAKAITYSYLFVQKSTVPVGFNRQVQLRLDEQRRLLELPPIFVLSNPEFLREGKAVQDFFFPDRVVFGAINQDSFYRIKQMYQAILDPLVPYLDMNFEEAELVKYASNGMLATRISFVNQLSLLAEKVGARMDFVSKGMGLDKRIGSQFLSHGIGYGGSCFPKDVKALIYQGKTNGVSLSLLEEVEAINQHQRDFFLEKIFNYYGSGLAEKTCGIWGLSFKPDTDDLRESPALHMIKKLKELCRKLVVYDPASQEAFKNHPLSQGVHVALSLQDVLAGADFLVVATEWGEFLTVSPEDFLQLGDKVVFDGRGCLDSRALSLQGITYVGIASAVKHEDLFLEKKASHCKVISI